MVYSLKIDHSQLKDDKGRYRTQSLFFETNQTTNDAIFTLKEYDHEFNGKKYISLKKLYLELAVSPEEGEYEFAMIVFGSWKHWKRLESNKLLAPHLEEWREELEIKTRSKALKALVETATLEGAKGTAAAKYIASGQYRQRKGRPSKADITREARIAAGLDEDIAEDMERLGIH